MIPFKSAQASLLFMACLISATAASDLSSRPEFGALFGAESLETEFFDLTSFHWLFDGNSTNLAVCASESLLNETQYIIVPPTLIYYQDETGTQVNIPGTIDKDNITCALFNESDEVRLPKTETQYYLSFIVNTTESESAITRTGSVSFAMTVETSTISCSEKPFTRVSGLTRHITIENCVNVDHTLWQNVCYVAGDYESSPLCYTDGKAGITICLQGSSNTTAEEVDDGPTINYLSYENDEGKAELSLNFTDDEATGAMEALVWKNGENLFATKCSGSSCLMQDFQPGFALYSVCAVVLEEELPVSSSVSSITDLKAKAYKLQDSPLLQFEYTNAYTAGTYNANVTDGQEAVDPVVFTVNCSHLSANSTCRGFLEITECNGAYVDLGYLDQESKALTNKIRFPCQQIS